MKQISLTRGKFALVDDEDFEYLSQWKWCVDSLGYAYRSLHPGRVWMHRLINNTPEGFLTDHINGNPLDNRKQNLRTVTQAQNQINRTLQKNSTSGFKGVSWNTRCKKWVSKLYSNRQCIFLGYYKNLLEAVVAYNEAAKKYHGEYAKLNQI